MREFKVGDRVVCIKESEWDFKGEVGEQYLITELLNNGSLLLEGDEEWENGVMPKRFKLVDDSIIMYKGDKYKVDKVLSINGNKSLIATHTPSPTKQEVLISQLKEYYKDVEFNDDGITLTDKDGDNIFVKMFYTGLSINNEGYYCYYHHKAFTIINKYWEDYIKEED